MGGARLSQIPSYFYDKVLSYFYKGSMKSCGKHVYIRPSSSDFKGLWNLSVGDYTSIPKGSVFYCTEAPLIIGKKVIFGPRPTIITGDHRIDVVGKYIMDSNDKLPENDAAVVIEDDVWTGANITMCNDRKRFCCCCRCCGYKVMSSLFNYWRCPCKSVEDEIYTSRGY